MEQSKEEKFISSKNEITKLLTNLNNHQKQTTKNISDIYTNLDTFINGAKTLRNNYEPFLKKQTGGVKKKLDDGFKNFLKQLRKYLKKDENWYKKFRNYLKDDEYVNIYDFKELLESPSDKRNWYSYQLDFDVHQVLEYTLSMLDSYGKNTLEREKLIRTIGHLKKKYKIPETKKIHEYTNPKLYKHLSIIIDKLNEKIDNKDINNILEEYDGLKSEREYLLIKLHELSVYNLKELYLQNIRECENNYKNKMVIKRRLLDYRNEEQQKVFVSRLAKTIKKYFYARRAKIEMNLVNSNIALTFYRIVTEDGKIEIDDIYISLYEQVFGFIKDEYEQYINNLSSFDIIHNKELPLGFVSTEIKDSADCLFASIAGNLDDPKIFKIINDVCKTKSKNINIKYLCANVDKLKIRIESGYIAQKKTDIAQQFLREITANHLEEYLENNKYILSLLSSLSETNINYEIYNEIGLDKMVDTYEIDKLSEINLKNITENFRKLIKKSEYLNPSIDLDELYWGDILSFNILSDFLNKYFGILIIYLSGSRDNMKEGSYIYSHYGQSIDNLKNTKYVILIRHNPKKAGSIGINYEALHMEKEKEIIRVFSVDKKSIEYKNYNSELKEFLKDILESKI